jgi:sugar/nucleoside kinase (ribokinase family)
MTTDLSNIGVAGPSIVVAGHICLDIIPTFPSQGEQDAACIEPGHLYRMGPAVCATGGAVSNTGLALYRLGISTTLMGKVADDLFGTAVLDILRGYQPELAEGMIVTPGENTSYSIVISPPGVDRAFLHCPGANDTFRASDLPLESLRGASLFHFGYPPLMEQIYSDGGDQLGDLFGQAQSQGVITSLDMSMPDPHSPAGQVDWRAWLARVLPSVDLFLPSLEEILFMLDRDPHETGTGEAGTDSCWDYDASQLGGLAEQLLELGASVVVLKLGEQGLYLRSANSTGQRRGPLESLSVGMSTIDWRQRELLAPCFEVEVAGTTGAGDSSIAGFLAALVGGAGPEDALLQAAAVGACSVESADATSGICNAVTVRRRIAAGWKRRTSQWDLPDWSWDDRLGVWLGPNDGLLGGNQE